MIIQYRLSRLGYDAVLRDQAFFWSLPIIPDNPNRLVSDSIKSQYKIDKNCGYDSKKKWVRVMKKQVNRNF